MKKSQVSVVLVILGYWLLLMESSIFSFPFVFIFSVISLIAFRNLKVSICVLILGLLSDSARVTNFGLTPIFIFLTYMAILIYEKYFGKNDIIAMISIIIFATLIYSYILSFSLINILLVIGFLIFFWISSFIYKYSLKK